MCVPFQNIRCRRASDLSSSDHKQAVIPGVINFPAPTFYLLLQTLTSLLAKIPIVIFHCSSSFGRATRCAGWLEDTQPPDSKHRVLILEGENLENGKGKGFTEP